MSLEELLKENTEATRAQNELLKQLLNSTGTSGATTSTTTTQETNDADDTTTDDAPKRKRGEPSPGKQRRTAAEVAEDKAADEAEAAAGGNSAAVDDKTEDKAGITFEGLKAKLATWLGEYASEADQENPDDAHPEVEARKQALKAVLNQLTDSDDGRLGAIAKDEAKIVRLNNWLEQKAFKADKGFGVGRLAADPQPTSADEDDDDLGI